MKPHRFFSENRFTGFITGLLAAQAGSILFAIVATGIELGHSTIGWSLAGSLDLFFFLLIIGCFFSLIPGGIGGFLLGLYLRGRTKKRALTNPGAIWTGSLLGGLAAVIICCVGIIIEFIPSRMYSFPESLLYIRFDWDWLFPRFIPEILAAILIASLAGGFSGWFLASRMLSSKYDTQGLL